MKKLGLLVMPLMAISLLASCGGDTPAESVEFMLSSDQPTTVVDKSATVYVDWKPTEHSIKFDSFTFVTEQSKVDKVTFDKESEARPMPVKITFTEDITEDISGTLSFAYEDVTSKTTGNSSVAVTIPKPEEPALTKEEFDYANSLIDVEKVQINSLTNFELTAEYGGEEYSTSMIFDRKKELAPSINHQKIIFTQKLGEYEIVSGKDKYSKLIPDDEEHCQLVEKSYSGEEWGEWGEVLTKDIENYYLYPTQCALEPALKEAGITELEPALTYENTEFKNGKFVYKGVSVIVSYNSDGEISEGSSIPVTININYKNKKLTNVDVESEEVTTKEGNLKVTASITYAYEDITPTWPIPE